jgi:plastocyanin
MHTLLQEQAMTLSRTMGFAMLSTALFAGACGGTDAPANTAVAAEPAVSAAAAPAPATAGDVVEVKMISGRGEVFEPADITVKRGDVVRFVLVSGVHNVSFPARQNPGGITLPKSSPYLQAPGQSYDLTVDLPAGQYHYQCDPHVAMGMVGTITVTD